MFRYSSLEEGVQRGRVEALRVNLYECPGHHGKFRFNGAGPFNDMFWITLMFLFGSKNTSVLRADSLLAVQTLRKQPDMAQGEGAGVLLPRGAGAP